MLRNDLYRPWFLNQEQWGFEIIDGEFSGVVIQLEKLDFSDNASEGNLDVQYHVIHKPELLTDEHIQGPLFKSAFELIINDIIKEALEIFENEKNRDDSTSESNSQ